MNKATALISVVLCLSLGSAAADDPTALIQEGEASLKAGEIDSGLALFRQAVQTDPGSSLAHTRLGGALLLKQENAEAIETFRKAIMLNGDNADAFVGMAIAYLHSGDYALARASLEEAKRIDPAKAPKVDELIAHIDRRESGDGGTH